MDRHWIGIPGICMVAPDKHPLKATNGGSQWYSDITTTTWGPTNNMLPPMVALNHGPYNTVPKAIVLQSIKPCAKGTISVQSISLIEVSYNRFLPALWDLFLRVSMI